MKSTRPVAVITGAARGIGKGCALELARGGFNLLINDRPDADSVEKLHATQQECLAEGVEVICFPADVGDLSLHEEMLDAAQNQWGRWGYPADIASTVRAMAEGKLIYTCGQAVAIDGGLSMPRF